MWLIVLIMISMVFHLLPILRVHSILPIIASFCGWFCGYCVPDVCCARKFMVFEECLFSTSATNMEAEAPTSQVLEWHITDAEITVS